MPRTSSLLPGTHLAPVALVRGEDRLLDAVEATVRYVETLPPDAVDGVAYKLGLELRAQKPMRRDEAGDVLTEPVRILAVLEEGLRRGTLSVSVADARTLVSVGRPARVDRQRRELYVEGDLGDEVEPGDVMEARFEFGGASYSFLSSIRRIERGPGESGFALGQPRALRVVRQRRSTRVQPRDESPVMVAPTSPFAGDPVQRPALNITSSGAAFAVSDERDLLLPTGTRIPRSAIRFHDGNWSFAVAPR